MKTINILGMEYALEWDTNAIQDHQKAGYCASSRCAIGLDSSLEKQRLGETLLHEIVEAIDFELQLDLKHEILSALAFAVYSVIKNNPELFIMIDPEKED